MNNRNVTNDLLLPCSLAAQQPADSEFARRVYVIASPIILTLGLCGNFAIIAILSKHRFRTFPITTLIKSHAIANIFCLFIGLFLGDYFRALSNFDFQQQVGTWGCRIHLTLSYALRDVIPWHFAVVSGFRLFMATSPILYASRYCRTLIRGAIAVIALLAVALSIYIFWSLTFQTPLPLAATVITGSNITAQNGLPSIKSSSQICRLSCAQSFYASWRIVDLALAIIIPFCLVLINTIAIPLIIYWQAMSKAVANGLDTNNIKPLTFSPPIPTVANLSSYDESSSSSVYCHYNQRNHRSSRRHNRNGRSTIENVASNLAAMLYYQDIFFLALSLPLLVYFLLIYFPPQPLAWLPFLNNASQIETMIEQLHFIYPFMNLVQYSITVVLFPVYIFCNSSTSRRRKVTATKAVPSISSKSASKSVVNNNNNANSASAAAVATQLQGLIDDASSTASEPAQNNLRPDDVDRLVAAITGDNCQFYNDDI